MKRKEVLIAVIGGCIGALLTMMVGLFMPVGVVAQSSNQGTVLIKEKIICSEIRVMDWSKGGVICSIYGDEHGGRVEVVGREGGRATMGIMKDGGSVFVHGKRSELASMNIAEDTGMVHVKGRGETGEAAMAVYETGGLVMVRPKSGKGGALMGVDNNRNGIIATTDKKGYTRRVQ